MTKQKNHRPHGKQQKVTKSKDIKATKYARENDRPAKHQQGNKLDKGNQFSILSDHSSSNSSSGRSGMDSGGVPSTEGLSVLQQKFKKKLEGARFRIINEQLYTSFGEESFSAFQSNPEDFDIYHVGYREQAAQWPINPLHCIVEWIQRYHPRAVIADMGCGDAMLSKSVQNKVHSFDLVSRDPERVIACDMAHVPLQDASVDVVVFCLSLMGTNIADFIREAHRILKPGGAVKIVEVRSRFDTVGGGGEAKAAGGKGKNAHHGAASVGGGGRGGMGGGGGKGGIKRFTRFLKLAGFDIVQRGNAVGGGRGDSAGSSSKSAVTAVGGGKNASAAAGGGGKGGDGSGALMLMQNKMFFEVEAVKNKNEPQFDETFSVKACVYKKR